MAISEAGKELVEDSTGAGFVGGVAKFCFGLDAQTEQVHSSICDRPIEICIMRGHFRQYLMKVLKPRF